MPRKTVARDGERPRARQASMRPRPDAAENESLWDRMQAAIREGFNEAAARCRGKRQDRGLVGGPEPVASMRPRPDAAENRRRRGRDGAGHRASMRPRPDAAENRWRRGGAGRARGASMRPRPDAAENAAPSRTIRAAAPRFNEAAARCRGKRESVVDGLELRNPASMRPRPDAAENAGWRRCRAAAVRGLQ